jgi:hypothetical protein
LHQAHLVGVYAPEEMPDELDGFVKFQASRDDHQIKKGERIAVLNVVGTSSYIPIFLADVCCYEDLEIKLSQQDVKVDQVSKVSLQRVLQESNPQQTP